MALIPALSRGAVDSELNYVYLEDGTGTYNVSTNPGGYGAPNPDRNMLALYLIGYKYVSDPDTPDTAIVINNTIPLTVVHWQIPIDSDGYNYFKLLAIPIWSAVTNYVVDKIVYYGGGYYICILNNLNVIPSANPAAWTEITDLTVDSVLTNPSIYVGTGDQVFNYRGKACFQTQIFLEAKDNCGCADKDTNRAEFRPYQKISAMLSVAGILCAQQKYTQADDELVSLNNYCASIGCSTC